MRSPFAAVFPAAPASHSEDARQPRIHTSKVRMAVHVHGAWS